MLTMLCTNSEYEYHRSNFVFCLVNLGTAQHITPRNIFVEAWSKSITYIYHLRKLVHKDSSGGVGAKNFKVIRGL